MAFYLYRDRYKIKMGQGDQQMGLHLLDKGYELFDRPLDTREQAEIEKEAWQKRVDEMRKQGLL